MENYYFLGALLPELSIGSIPYVGFSELEQLLQDNLSSHDYFTTRSVRQYYDISNLRLYWKGDPLEIYGNLTLNELEEAIATRSFFPGYVFDFMDKYPTKEERLRHYPELLAIFLKNTVEKSEGFLKFFLSLERELRLILAAHRAKKLGRNISDELRYEDSEESIIEQILSQKDTATYEPPEKYEDIRALIAQQDMPPLQLHRILLEYRFNKIDEKLGIDLFSMDRILAYMVKLIIIEKWLRMDKEKGMQIVDRIIKEAS